MSSEVADSNEDDEILVLEPVPELSELVEFDPLSEGTDPGAETPLEFNDELEEVVAAIGAETLLAWLEWGSGRAMVTGCG
jgi:hypothetical protein